VSPNESVLTDQGRLNLRPVLVENGKKQHDVILKKRTLMIKFYV